MYVTTKLGKCYHRKECRYAKKAKESHEWPPVNFAPCSNCIAPNYDRENAIVIDTEGTVFPTQIAAVRLKTGETYHAKAEYTRLKPTTDKWIIEQHDAIVAFGGKTATVLMHNAKHDLAILNGSYMEIRGEDFFPKEWRIVDTVPIFRHFLPALSSYKLGSIMCHLFGSVKEVGHEVKVLHTAVSDARVLRECLCLMNVKVIGADPENTARLEFLLRGKRNINDANAAILIDEEKSDWHVTDVTMDDGFTIFQVSNEDFEIVPSSPQESVRDIVGRLFKLFI